MGLVYADIILINGEDLILAKRKIIPEENIKQMKVKMLVDSGAYMLAINENIQEQLQLTVKEKRMAELADGSIQEFDVVGPIEIKFKNRRSSVDAMVLKGDTEPLLGAIPMEDMPARLPSVTNRSRRGCPYTSSTTRINSKPRTSLFRPIKNEVDTC